MKSKETEKQNRKQRTAQTEREASEKGRPKGAVSYSSLSKHTLANRSWKSPDNKQTQQIKWEKRRRKKKN
jgi:hypothetical protein